MSEEKTTTACKIIHSIDTLEKERKQLVADHEKRLKAIDHKLEQLRSYRRMASKGLSTEKIALAESVMRVEGSASKCVPGHGSSNKEVRPKAIEDAIRSIASSPDALSKQYIGVKNYSGFGDQRCDCEYFLGPRHGSIVFMIGRTQDAMKRELTETEREAAIYYLENLAEIQSQNRGEAA